MPPKKKVVVKKPKPVKAEAPATSSTSETVRLVNIGGGKKEPRSL